MKRVMEEAKFKIIEPGTYPVTCVAVRPDTLENPQYGSGDVIKFKVEFDGMEDDDGAPLTRETMASDYLTPGSKLTRFLFAFGIVAGVGEEVEIEEAVGRSALAVVGKKVKGDKVYDSIDNLIPAPKTATTQKATPAPAQRPTEASAPGDVPSVVKSDGSCDWPRFWATLTRYGLNESHVVAHAGDGYGAIDGPDAQKVLEELIAIANS